MTESISVDLIRRLTGNDVFYVRIINDNTESQNTDKYPNRSANLCTINDFTKTPELKNIKSIRSAYVVVDDEAINDPY